MTTVRWWRCFELFLQVCEGLNLIRPINILIKRFLIFVCISFQDFLNQIDYDRTRHLRTISERELVEMMSYITTCFEMCWSMAVQDPPMYLLFKVKHGHDIDRGMFDRYLTTGQRADFAVWPAVLTEENGSCLQKGVMFALPERSWITRNTLNIYKNQAFCR